MARILSTIESRGELEEIARIARNVGHHVVCVDPEDYTTSMRNIAIDLTEIVSKIVERPVPAEKTWLFVADADRLPAEAKEQINKIITQGSASGVRLFVHCQPQSLRKVTVLRVDGSPRSFADH